MKLQQFLPVVILGAAVFTACGSPGAPASSVQPFADTTQSAEPAPSASAAPSALSVADTVPQGSWTGAEKVVKVGGNASYWWDPVPKKGQVLETGDPWEFTSTCSDTVCTGKIARASDKKDGVPGREFSWDGTRLLVTRDPLKGTDGCHYDNSTKDNGGRWTWQRGWTYDTSVDTDGDGRVTAIHSDVTIRDEALKVPYEKCGAKPKAASYVVRSTMKPA